MNIKLAIDKMMKGDLNASLKSLSTQTGLTTLPLLDPATYRHTDGNHFFMGPDGIERNFTYTGYSSIIKAYEYCPPVSAIIDRKAQAYINGKTWILNSQGKESTTAEAKKLRALFSKPNQLQSWKQFEAQGYIYQQMFGYNIVLLIKPFGLKDNIDADKMWNIPPSMIDVEETAKLFNQSNISGSIKQIVLNYKGTRTPINLDDVIIMKDIKPSFSTLLLPESRIKSLELPINNIIGAYESRNVLINYRGALGILSHDPGSSQFASPILDPDDKENLQKDFRRYGLKGHQWQFIITSASLKWQQMGSKMKDLMLFEEVEADIMAICDEYNYPYQLMSAAKGVTFANLKEGKQLVYQDGTIPEAQSMYEQWNNGFKTSTYNINIDKDFTHVPALQENELEMMKARFERDNAYKIEWENGLITRNMWRVANGEDPVAGDDILIGETQPETQPLAVTIGITGVQSLITVITDPLLTTEEKRNTLVVVFGISMSDATRMVSDQVAPQVVTTPAVTTPAVTTPAQTT